MIAERVLRTVREHGLIARGGRVVVALSGGPDSVALVHILRELERAGELAVAGLAHLNHRLRGADADEDEQFCRALAASLGLPVEVGRADVRELAREQGRSIEDAARVARYAFLHEAADRLGAEAIAVGHSRDDQAETFLLRLIRGSGPRGLAGILPKAGRVVRPLLGISRAELRAYVADRGIAYREDATNADLDLPRNRVRHELIPYLEREFSQGIVGVLAREAAIAREDEDRLQKEAIDLATSVVLRDIHGVQVEVGVLTSLHPALAARVARIALSELAGSRFVGFDHIAAFLDFVRNGAAGASLSLPGQQVQHRGSSVLLRPAPQRGAVSPKRRSREGGGHHFRFPLSIPGEVILTPQGWTISAEPLEGLPDGARLERIDGREGVRLEWIEAPDGACPERGPQGRVERGACPERGPQGRVERVAVASAALRLPLSVRNRRPGDRFRPLGLGGAQKKLQDFLVDRKVARETRDALPLVVDDADRIVWVVGQSVGEDFRVTKASQGVILLKARRLGGEG